MVFAGGEGGGFLDADDVVFEAEIGVDVFFALEVAGDDAGTVGEGDQATGNREVVRQPREQAPAEVFEMLEVRFADFAEQQAFEARHALAVIHAHLGEKPIGFAAAAGAAEADGGGAVGAVTEAGGGAGGKLLGLEEHAGTDEVVHLILRTTRLPGGGDEMGELGHGEVER